jgi:hypothetical protein
VRQKLVDHFKAAVKTVKSDPAKYASEGSAVGVSLLFWDDLPNALPSAVKMTCEPAHAGLSQFALPLFGKLVV